MTEDSQPVITLAALAIGLSIAMVVWLVARSMAATPMEDRQYKDPPPWGFRLLWWPIQWLAHGISRVQREKSRDAQAARLRKAGLDYSVSPAQFTASCMVAAVLAAGLTLWLLHSLASAQAKPAELSASLQLQAALLGALFGYAYPALWLKDRLAIRRNELLKTLPFYLDIITLCVEAGLNLQGAIQQSVNKGPAGVLREEFRRVIRDVRAGKSRAESLRTMAERLNEGSVTNFVSAVIQAESMGMNLGPVLRAQADQRRSERFMRAEKLAMEAPVKMLFPLIAFIFPCTFIVLFFPIVMKFMHSGL